jgi:hypothetical protein
MSHEFKMALSSLQRKSWLLETKSTPESWRLMRITVSLQSDERVADEKASVEARFERSKKYGLGNKPKPSAGGGRNSEAPPQIEAEQPEEEAPTTLAFRPKQLE